MSLSIERLSCSAAAKDALADIHRYLDSHRQRSPKEVSADGQEHDVIWWPHKVSRNPNKQPPAPRADLYYGVSGIVFFYLKLFNLTGNAEHLLRAIQGGNFLISNIPNATVGGPGLYLGLSGIVFVLGELYETTLKDRFLSGFKEAFQKLRRSAIEVRGKGGELEGVRWSRDFKNPWGGQEWNSEIDVTTGSIGVGCLLLHLHSRPVLRRACGEDLLCLAEAIGRRVMQLGVEGRDANDANGEGFLEWTSSAELGYQGFMPNFSHGTAAAVFFLARLFHRTRRRAYLDFARRGARHLQREAIALTPAAALGGGVAGRGWLLPRVAASSKRRKLAARAGKGGGDGGGGCGGGGDGCAEEAGGSAVCYLGWCHGPPGTMRAFYQLSRVCPGAIERAQYADWVDKLGDGLAAGLSVALERRDSCGMPTSDGGMVELGMWNNSGQCCGWSGAGSAVVNLETILPLRRFSVPSTRLVREILARSSVAVVPGASEYKLKGAEAAGGQTRCWRHAEHRILPKLQTTFTGYSQGVAGIGAFLVDFVASQTGAKGPPLVLPDCPKYMHVPPSAESPRSRI